MSKYSKLHYNVNHWYDWLNDTKNNRTYYALLSCFAEFPDDYE